MPKQRILHLSTLERKGACTQQVELFRDLFGESVTVTEKKAVSVADRFDWTWASDKLLSQTALYGYKAVVQTAWGEYNKVVQIAWDKYSKTVQTVWSGYNKTVQPARDEYNKTLARTFANLYIKDN